MSFAPNLALSDVDLTNIAIEEESSMQLSNSTARGIKQIALTEDCRQRIYEPWKSSIIIKLVGKRMLHQYLKKKIQELWHPTEDLSLIDLGEDYYIIKFRKKENMEKAINQGPWFINGHFLLIIKWKPNFVATKERLTTSAVWIRLPHLPTEFYDSKFLEKIGNAIGRLLKIDVCTSATLRGCYARICVEIPLDIPVQPFLYIGLHKQYIYYEGEDYLCKKCGRFGHTMDHYSYILKTPEDTNSADDQPTQPKENMDE
ncbi:PREDICTED: uncharacterized protein LOC109212329 [Nicotiana attenuata]|uniref:uncharacterized protein LOC109212329 n=1 Tax=Nicotiana attenuata TaxID=49451 RepID=UPI000904CE9C|nr:PREDICTED: uncharacterized protein LOC109212329 [Nicotiana attenuata]